MELCSHQVYSSPYCAIARKFTFEFVNDDLRMHLECLVHQLPKNILKSTLILGSNNSNYSWKQQIEPTNRHKMKSGPIA